MQSEYDEPVVFGQRVFLWNLFFGVVVEVFDGEGPRTRPFVGAQGGGDETGVGGFGKTKWV